MMEIIKCNDEVLAMIPNIMGHIYEYFEDHELALYAVLKDGRLGFIARDGLNGIYLQSDNEDYSITPFSLHKDGSLAMVAIGNDSLFFRYAEDIIGTGNTLDDTMLVDKEGIEHLIGIRKLVKEDIDGYDGFIYHIQYNKKNDTACDIRYQQMYREVNGKVPIYGFHTRRIDVVSIDEHCNKNGYDIRGFLPRTAKYYSRYEFDSGRLGYTLATIKDYGLIRTITSGAYALQKQDKVTKYIKAFYVKKSGNFLDMWPLAEQKTEEEMRNLVRRYGFKDEIPGILMAAYNGNIAVCNELKELAKQMQELVDAKDEEKVMFMKLTLDSE